MAKKNRNAARSSGNVFADLGLPQSDEKKTKVRLAVELNRVIENAGLSQSGAAEKLKINQPKVSALMNYRLEGFSVERLMNFLNLLGRDIEILIRKPRAQKVSGIRVTAA